MRTYTSPAIFFHWLTFFVISGMFVLGFYMADLPTSPTKLQLFSWHKWAGVTLFMIVLLRLCWRLLNPPPALPDTLPAWQRSAAHASHHVLYLLMLAMPLSGWLMSSAKGFTTVWFGVLPLPDLLEKNKELGKTLATVHETLAYVILALVALHVAAALKHHFVDRDSVLASMLPGLKSKQ
jgi:cytochrome b561